MEPTINGELIPQGGGDSVPLVRSPLILGRRASCDVCLPFASVSGKHCNLTFKDGFWILHDLDSTNGTKVNGFMVNMKVIRTGDTIKIGQRSFTLQYQELGNPKSLEEFDTEWTGAFSVPLLEKAGLTHKPRHPRRPDMSKETVLPDDDSES